MAGAVELAVAYVSIVAEASRLGPSVRRGLAGVEVEGRKAGTATGQEFTRGADTATNLAGVTRKVTESKGAAAKASGQYEQAIRREKDTSTTLGIAEARLAELRASGTAKASQVLRAEQQVELWRQVVNRTLAVHQGHPLALLGMAAWIAGEGALVSVCLERAGRLLPPAGLLRILRGLVDQVTPPDSWDELQPQLLAAASGEVRQALAVS